MASTFSYFSTASPIVSASAVPDDTRRKAKKNTAQWWTPLFGFSSDPDYINGSASAKSEPRVGLEVSAQSENEAARSRSSKFALGCFTEEKAKELRKKTIENSTFHDIMYHSAIASRLASDVSRRGNL